MISSFVLTGFLGVGKTTTLISSVKEHFQDKKVAIIVNEFGDIGVDGNILKNVHSDVLEISEGCICCQLAQEFESGVIEIIEKYDPELLIVETSGASEPFPIFMSLQNLNIAVEGVICVIDSKNFDSYKDNSTAKYQIGGSNIIVLNKKDLVTEDEIAKLKEEIKEIKEEYNIKNTLTGQTVFNGYQVYYGEQGLVDKEVFEGVYEVKELENFAKEHKEHDHTKKDAITQKVAYIKGDVAFQDIDDLLKELPKNIYRVKGIVKLTDVPNPLFINYSYGSVSFEELDNYNEEAILVFIGENVTNDLFSLDDKFDFLSVPRFTLNKG